MSERLAGAELEVRAGVVAAEYTLRIRVSAQDDPGLRKEMLITARALGTKGDVSRKLRTYAN